MPYNFALSLLMSLCYVVLCEYLPQEFPLWGTIKGYCIALFIPLISKYPTIKQIPVYPNLSQLIKRVRVYPNSRQYLDTPSVHLTDLCPLTGHHNDCFLASSLDRGTYINRSLEYPYLKDDTKYTVMGGETCSLSEDEPRDR